MTADEQNTAPSSPFGRRTSHLALCTLRPGTRKVDRARLGDLRITRVFRRYRGVFCRGKR
eukprot:scaffold94867_cov63-Phaeocystis_antarctica.AAC.7